jgi:hypothetical protein
MTRNRVKIWIMFNAKSIDLICIVHEWIAFNTIALFGTKAQNSLLRLRFKATNRQLLHRSLKSLLLLTF